MPGTDVGNATTRFEAYCSCKDAKGKIDKYGSCTYDPNGCKACDEHGQRLACYKQNHYYSQCLVVGTCPDGWDCKVRLLLAYTRPRRYPVLMRYSALVLARCTVLCGARHSRSVLF
eukprot:2554609-Rhodomonas_salina.3